MEFNSKRKDSGFSEHSFMTFGESGHDDNNNSSGQHDIRPPKRYFLIYLFLMPFLSLRHMAATKRKAKDNNQ